MTPSSSISTELERYLASDVWRKRRKRYKRHAKNRCESCDARWPLTVHHLNYDRLNGKERNDYLVCLCVACHSRQHPGKTVHCGPFACRYSPDEPYDNRDIPHPQEATR